MDIGVRVELPSIIWEHFSKKIYEPKILYRSKQYGDTTRMFCFNERGQVVTENTDGILTVNGHAFRSEEKKSKNSNFALLSTIRFTQPFNSPIEYARHVASLANLISGGSVLVQRLGDLMVGRRTRRKAPGSVLHPADTGCRARRPEPVYAKAPAGQHCGNPLCSGQNCPGHPANYDTLLYGIECKYYSADRSVKLMLSGTKEIYAIGDGAGHHRSLSRLQQRSYVADQILAAR